MGGGIESNSNFIRLGKNGQNQINLDNLKAGINLDDKMSAIFGKFDKNNNGILEKAELDMLKNSLAPYVEDGVLSNREAKKVLKDINLKNIQTEELFQFLQEAELDSNNVDSSFYSLFDDVEAVNVKYKKNSDGNVITSSFNAETGAKIQDIIESENETRTICYGEDGKPVSEEIKKGALTTSKDALGRVVNQTTNKGNGLCETVAYEYEGDSTTPSKITTTKPDGTIIETDGEGNPINPSEIDAAAEAENPNQTVFENGRIMIKTENGATIQEPGKDPVEIKYDADRNILSNAKNGETFAQTAKRLGIMPNTPEFDKFKELNQKAAKNGWFVVGAEVKIPAGMEDKINLDGVNVDSKAESAKFSDAAIRNADISKYNESNTETRTLDKNTTWWNLAKETLSAEGNAQPTNVEITTRMNELQKLNSGKQPAKGVEITLPKAQTLEPRSETVKEDAAEETKPETKTETPEEIPETSGASEGSEITEFPQLNIKNLNDLKKLLNEGSGDKIVVDLFDDIHAKTKLGLPTTRKTISDNIAKITPDNVEEVLTEYAKKSAEAGENESLVEAVLDEVGLSGEEKVKYVTHIKDQLLEKIAYDLRNDPNTLKEVTDKFNAKFDSMINKSMLGFYNTSSVDKLITELMELAAQKREMNQFGIGDANGKIDYQSSQGDRGNCWLLAGLTSLSKSKNGEKLISDAIKHDPANQCFKVYIAEAGKEYTVSYYDLNYGQLTYSKGDSDVRIIELAVQKYFEEIGEQYDGNTTKRLFELFTGRKEDETKSDEININRKVYDNGELSERTKTLITDSINSGSPLDIFNIPLENRQQEQEKYFDDILSTFAGRTDLCLVCVFNAELLPHVDGSDDEIVSGHGYTVSKIDSEHVYLINPWDSSKEIVMSRKEFCHLALNISVAKP